MQHIKFFAEAQICTTKQKKHKHRNNNVTRCYFYSDSYFAWYFWNTACVTLTTIRWPDVVMTYRQKRAFQLLSFSLSSFPASPLALCVPPPPIRSILSTYSLLMHSSRIRIFNSLLFWFCRLHRGISRTRSSRERRIVCHRGARYILDVAKKLWIIVNTARATKPPTV